MKAAEWIDLVKKRRGWDSDYRVAKELEFRASTISQYRSHGGTLDEGIALKVAAALGEKLEVILVDQAMERSKTDEGRSAFGRALKRLGGAHRAVASGGAGDGKGGLNISKSASNGDDLYIVSNIWQALKAALSPVSHTQLAPA